MIDIYLSEAEAHVLGQMLMNASAECTTGLVRVRINGWNEVHISTTDSTYIGQMTCTELEES